MCDGQTVWRLGYRHRTDVLRSDGTLVLSILSIVAGPSARFDSSPKEMDPGTRAQEEEGGEERPTVPGNVVRTGVGGKRIPSRVDAARRTQSVAARRGRARRSEGITAESPWEELTDETVFSNTDHDPGQALLLHLANSGSYRFKDLAHIDGTVADDVEAARQEIVQELRGQAPGTKRQHEMLEELYADMGRSCHELRPGMETETGAKKENDEDDDYDGPYRDERGRPSSWDRPVLTCACCGIRDVHRGDCRFDKVNNVAHQQIFEALKLDDSEIEEYEYAKSLEPLVVPTDDKGGTKEVRLHDAFCVTEHRWGGVLEYYWLHDFLVRTDDSVLATHICRDCHNALSSECPRRPEQCLSDVNFGVAAERLGLEPLTLMERMMLAKARHHFCIVKIQSNTRIRQDHQQSQIRGHCIMFEHDAPLATAYVFSNSLEALDCQIKLHFIGPREEMDNLMRNTVGTSIVRGRPFVLYQYLAVLRLLHPAYWKDSLPSLRELQDKVDAAERHLLSTAMRTDSKTVVGAEDAIGDDVADPTGGLPSPDELFGCDVEQAVEASVRHSEATTLRGPFGAGGGCGEDSGSSAALDGCGCGRTDSSAAPASDGDILVETVAESMECDGCETVEPQSASAGSSGDDGNAAVACDPSVSAAINPMDRPVETCNPMSRADDLSGLNPMSRPESSWQDEPYEFPPDADAVPWRAASMRCTLFQGRSLNDQPTEDALLHDHMLGVADALNIPVRRSLPVHHVRREGDEGEDADCETVLRSARGDKLNEFEMGDKCLTLAFPDLFLFGKAYGRERGALLQKQRHHMLRQYHGSASTNKDLLTFLFDQQIRHGNIQRISHFVKGNPDRIAKLTRLRTLPDFAERLANAIDKPKSKDAKWILRQITPLLSIAQRKAQYGALERNESIAKTKALSRRYGSGCVFFTIAPPDEDNPTSLRLALHSPRGNTVFPAQHDATVLDEMEHEKLIAGSTCLGETTVDLPYTYAERMSRTIADPVATVLEYKQLISALITVMFGIRPNFSGHRRHTNRSQFCGGRKKGVYGLITSLIGVNEAQARGKLHFHCILFGGIPPEVLQKVSHIEELRKAAAKALNEMFCASLPRAFHARQIIERRMRGSKAWKARLEAGVPEMYKVSPSPHNDDADFKRRHRLCACRYNIHIHCFTCHKGKIGEECCRMCYPRGICSETRPVELSEDYDDDGLPCVMTVEPPDSFVPTHGQPFPEPTKRLIAWDMLREGIDKLDLAPESGVPAAGVSVRDDRLVRIKALLGEECTGIMEAYLSGCADEDIARIVNDLLEILPEANGRVVEYTPLIMAAIPGNHAAYSLGTSDQSNSSLIYLSSYVAKNKVAVVQILSTMQRAARDVSTPQFKSVAQDSGTDQRTSQHILQRTINKLDSAMEYSDTQMAASLLDFPTEIITDKFGYFSPTQALNYTLYRQGKLPLGDGGAKKRTAASAGLPSSAGIAGRLSKAPKASGSGHGAGTGVVLGPSPDRLGGTCSGEIDLVDEDVPYQETCAIEDGDIFTSDREPSLDIGRHGFYTVTGDVEVSVAGVKLVEKNRLKSLMVNYNDHWQHRGYHLRNLSRVEYNSVVVVERLHPDREDEWVKAEAGSSLPIGTGKRPNTVFLLADNHPLSKTHGQRLLSKHLVLIFTGRDPIYPAGARPGDPDKAKEWDQKQEKFGAFYVHAYRPEPDNYDGVHPNRYTYSYKDYCDYLQELRQEGQEKTAQAQLRLKAIERSVTHFRSSQNKRDRMTAHRGRSKQVWSVREKNSYRSYLGRRKLLDGKGTEDGDDVAGVSWAFDNSKQLRAAYAVKFRNGQIRALDSVLGSAQEVCARAQRRYAASTRPADPTLMVDRFTVDGIIDELKDAKHKDGEDSTAGVDGKSPPCDFDSAQQYLDSIPEEEEPTDEQMEVLRIAIGHFEKVKANRVAGQIYSDEASPKILLLGGPGSGKTTSVNHVPELARAMKAGIVLRFSFMGITSILAGGATFSSTFFPFSARESGIKELNKNDLKRLQTRYDWDRVAAIILDEISTFSPLYLATVDKRLRQVTCQPDTPFGGIMIWLVGDFMQAKAIQQKHFPTGMMGIATETEDKPSADFAVGTMSRQGLELFREFDCYQLAKHNRTKDPRLADLITRMHDGGSMKFSDLKNIKPLSPEDIAADGAWEFAPILVQTNRERFDLTASQAIRFAAGKGVPVVRWPRNKTGAWDNMPPDRDQRAAIAREDPCFWQYSVVGAEAFMNANIEVEEAKCANGTPCIIHSYAFQTKEIARCFFDRYMAASPGEVMTLTGLDVPYSVNVVPWPGHPKRQDASNAYSILKALALEGDTRPVQTVIPLTATCFTPKKDKNGTPIAGGVGYGPSQVYLTDRLPIELGFAMTFDKSLGRTLAKVVLGLYPRDYFLNIDFHKFFVVLSRTEGFGCMRFLAHEGSSIKDFRYLCDLAPDPRIVQLLEGYSCGQGSTWDAELAIAKKDKMENAALRRKEQQKRNRAKVYRPERKVVGATKKKNDTLSELYKRMADSSKGNNP